ncbi:triose-phosphate isomerase [Candidatus Parcubacteria bacterium]|uniref:Triosephosphate isomerase n=1 Tax=Candidatus Kaiserbacteria bacterium CG10_big_fil_rev_8_21_14_0_10_47_16 TaxID=1974608 RepID=A0A2H0UDX9_9BACT|nr:triose-phosphate isomerase [Candidatus Parcubacteria bacterium]PIR84560.1 MAG: triose-phosphate isomerase [Candidatus Kaiserbacteria bacterium CG10_big_fil_rev_8_21_14_0_10_47_16]
MKATHTPLVIANWKMNPGTLAGATRLFKETQTAVSRSTGVTVVVAPPAVYLAECARRLKSKKLLLGAQNVYFEKLGAYTGEIGMSMLKSMHALHVILGHSERRARGETSEQVAQKLQAVLKDGGTAIVCVGERERDSHGQYLGTVEEQVRKSLSGLSKNKLGNVVIAYEPVWAIGTGNTATPEDAHEMKLFIQKVLSDMFGRVALARVRIIYGGSVTKQNADALLKDGEVDGFLVGGASLRASEFAQIVKAAQAYGS